ncbi:MAG TPA: prolipoprotein diacylglyceryl transferase [Hyphomicrobiales bacterium]|nr:prolipoprotein diacylglyceryl transferase [Hyphomicrobiales bacterium]
MPFLPVIAFPMIDPVALQLGPLAIRWYALAYIAGLLIGWWVTRREVSRPALWGRQPPIEPAAIDDLLVWMALGVVLGGRIGYVLFYNLPFYAGHPLKALEIWQGGMSFHGGLLGSVVAMALFARSRRAPLLPIFDLVATVVPIGLFFGRIANFINGELWGRVTDVPWAMVFPHAGPLPRHPSELYEAGMEGLILFAILMALVRFGGLRRPGLVAGTFLAGYGIFRIVGETFREPDVQIGFLWQGVTMGMVLSAPMVLVGLGVVAWSLRRTAAAKPAE